MTKPRVGVVFRPPSPPEELRAAVVAAEDAGLDELWLWEDCFNHGGLTATTAALAWSERLTVGIGLLPVALRNPALVAMEISTLARLFPGRLLPALGHGVLDWMAQAGVRAESPMTLLREHTAAVRALLHGETLDVSGRYVQLTDVALEQPPGQVPPVIIGARGAKTIQLAGEISDGVLLDADPGRAPDLERIAAAVRLVVDAAAGRPAPAVVAFVEVDGGSAAQIDELVAQHAEAGVTSVILQGPTETPDPTPLIAALATRSS